MIAIDKKQHLQSTVAMPTGCDAFVNCSLIPLSSDEILQTVALMPMAFQLFKGHWRLVGIVSIEAGHNQFIGGKGQWGGYYRPRALNQPPLAITTVGKEQQTLTLFVDETSSGWHPKGGDGERLFDDSGEQTPFLKQCMSELKRAHLLGLKLIETLPGLVEQEAIIPWQPEDIAWFGGQGLYRANPQWLSRTVNNDERVDNWLFKLLLAQQFSVAGMNRLRRGAANLARQKAGGKKAGSLEGFSLSSDEIELDFSNLDAAD